MYCWSCHNPIFVPAPIPRQFFNISENVQMTEQVIQCPYCKAAYTVETYIDKPSSLKGRHMADRRNVPVG